ncbi:hypothetical protein BDQ17DRAFT_1431789 [Cyathus striatus]|nr:hypothetical protein BDQ17DRAFT_1431789 [Cyathus striatus]
MLNEQVLSRATFIATGEYGFYAESLRTTQLRLARECRTLILMLLHRDMLSWSWLLYVWPSSNEGDSLYTPRLWSKCLRRLIDVPVFGYVYKLQILPEQALAARALITTSFYCSRKQRAFDALPNDVYADKSRTDLLKAVRPFLLYLVAFIAIKEYDLQADESGL